MDKNRTSIEAVGKKKKQAQDRAISLQDINQDFVTVSTYSMNVTLEQSI